MTIQEYLDLINDWDSDVPMSTAIKISKSLRKVTTNFEEYSEESEFDKTLLVRLKETFIRDNGEGDWVDASIFVDGFLGQVEE